LRYDLDAADYVPKSLRWLHMSWLTPRILTIPVFLSCAFAVHARQENVRFEPLSLQHGLSQTTVSTMIQDDKGFMWFGTSDGLNKYDGYNFTVYRNNPRHPNSISDDWVTAIYESRHGGTATLWMGTARGVLNKYDGEKDEFIRYYLRDSFVCLAGNGRVHSGAPYMVSFFVDSTITAITEDFDSGGSTLWIGTWGCGLYKLVLPPSSLSESSVERRIHAASLQYESQMPKGLGQTLWANGKANHGIAQIIHYQHDPSDPNSLSDNSIHAICRDESGTLWIGTLGGGVNKFNKETETFTHYKHDPNDLNSLSNNFVWSIYQDNSGTLWIGTFGGGLNKLIRHSPNAPGAAPLASCGQHKGTRCKGVHFIHYQQDPSDPHSLSDDDVTAILEDKRGTLWVGTFGGGLNKFDRETGRFAHFKHDPYNLYSLGDDDVLSLYEDESGIIWIGAHLGSGLSKFDRKKQKFTHYKNDPANANSLSDDIVWSIHEDSNQDGSVLWIGTYRGGLNRFDRKRNQYVHYQHDPADPHSLSQNHVRAIYEDESETLWIGTYSEGLNKFDPKTNRFTRYKHNPSDPNSLSNNQIRSICGDKSGSKALSGTLWIGTFGGGLNQLDKRKEEFKRYRHDPTDENSLSDDRVYCVYQDRSGTLWIGTYGGGLNKLAPLSSGNNSETVVSANGAASHQKSVHFIRYVHDASNPNSLSDNRVLAIYESRPDPAVAGGEGTLWVGTDGGGLNKFDRKSGKFRQFSEKDGLPSDLILGILEDDNGNLWLSTNNGLSKLDPQTMTFKNYDESDGVQSKEFSGGAYCQSERGEMFFGGVNGLNGFFPNGIKENSHVPPIVITAFKKFGEEVKLENGDIELSHTDSFFSIEFAALDYCNPAKNQYAYRLDGFDKKWNYCGTRRFASYTNLDPGEYIFRVKGANNDGVWNEAGVSLKIAIRPPFWRTRWFLFLCVGFVFFAAFLLHNARVKFKIRQLLEMERVRKEENERLRKQVARDFHDDLGHKLTNILLYTEILKRSLNGTSPQGVEYLNKISEVSKSLSFGIRDFIWALDPKKDSLYDVVVRLKDFGDELFAKSGIDFHAVGASNELESVTLSIDWRRHLTLLFKEAMNNILKHASCKNVSLQIALNHKTVEISLSDDGKGIENGNISSGLGLRNMKKHAERIQGELNVISNNGHGTTIRFKGKIP
jgi:ligand-binding sensor domain-containing protein/signal transduction histidine kinase